MQSVDAAATLEKGPSRVIDPLRVRTAATVICVRRSIADRPFEPPLLRKDLCEDPTEKSERTGLLFGSSDAATISSTWEVLLGQGEVQNWMRSTPEQTAAMRYPGEWKFAGGTMDADETPEQAARRELEEEFLVKLPDDATECKFRLLSITQTRPVRSVSYIMHNFVAIAEENPWLQQLSTCAVNATLEKRRVDHALAVECGAFWSLGTEEKERLSPEVREVRWLDMQTAVKNAFTSMNSKLLPVNDFQATEFARLGLESRDPMLVTMAALLEVDAFPSMMSFRSQEPDPKRAKTELAAAQWCFGGFSPEEVAAAWRRKRELGVFRNAEERATLRTARASLEVQAHEKRKTTRSCGFR